VRAGVCACLLLLVAVTPAAGAAQRNVTLYLSGTGKAFWKLDSSAETGRLALRYRWHGTISFAVPRSKLRDPKHRGLSVTRIATLSGGWSGSYSDRRGGVRSTCTYTGANVKTAVRARLATGRAPDTLELTFNPRSGKGFFPDQGRRAKIRCTKGATQSSPPHFAPSWFFRDNLQDRGRFSSQTAVLVLPGTLFTHGKATLTFPFERGRNESGSVGRLAWHNRGTVTIRSR
jgi:hypothetical protein